MNIFIFDRRLPTHLRSAIRARSLQTKTVGKSVRACSLAMMSSGGCLSRGEKGIPEMAAARVTSSPEVFDNHFESHQLLWHGSPLFERLARLCAEQRNGAPSGESESDARTGSPDSLTALLDSREKLNGAVSVGEVVVMVIELPNPAALWAGVPFGIPTEHGIVDGGQWGDNREECESSEDPQGDFGDETPSVFRREFAFKSTFQTFVFHFFRPFQRYPSAGQGSWSRLFWVTP